MVECDVATIFRAHSTKLYIVQWTTVTKTLTDTSKYGMVATIAKKNIQLDEVYVAR